MSDAALLRATIFHTPADPFRTDEALRCFTDGALLIRDGRIVSVGEYSDVRTVDAGATVIDWRGGFILPGLVDTHIHFPQVRIIGSLGRSLLDWLETTALPEESRMSDVAYARLTARTFLNLLAAHGTTTALVFGAHFAEATAILFEEAGTAGLRIISGLVMSDRALRPELHQSPAHAYRDATALIDRFHGQGRLRYAITPRFALSASEAMLEVCQTLRREHADVTVQSHVNEQRAEIVEVSRLFPWAADYLAVYQRYELDGPRSVFAHNVWPTDSELERLAGRGTSIAHCPCSNAALGSGIFPFRRHLAAGVHCALGTDVGGGTGFGILKEALQTYLLQRVAPDGVTLDAGQLLYLATLAGAKALGLDSDVGDFSAGKAADLVYIRPDPGTALCAAIDRADDAGAVLGAIITLGDASSIRDVWVNGSSVRRAVAT